MALATGIQRFSLSQVLARLILRLIGWRTRIIPPPGRRYILIGAPHTSNWDFFFMLLLMAAERIPIRWLGKDTLFRWPLGPVMRSLGAIPVNRRERTRLVDQIAVLFSGTEDLVIGLSPEGTRGKTTRWRTGFYYMALAAQVPIVMAYIDYQERIIGIGPSFIPGGDIQADFETIRAFYTGLVGRHPEKQGPIEFFES